MHTLPSQRVRFGTFELDLSTGELRSTQAPDPNNKVLLREQVFRVLRMLVEREGKLVTREEIKSRLWANDTVVDFDQSINATIKALRRALGDSADNPQYIETLGRRGYRLMLTIEYPGATAGDRTRRGRRGGSSSQRVDVVGVGDGRCCSQFPRSVSGATKFIAIASLLLPPTQSCWPTSKTELATLFSTML